MERSLDPGPAHRARAGSRAGARPARRRRPGAWTAVVPAAAGSVRCHRTVVVPAVRETAQTIEAPSVEPETALEPPYDVLLHNDDVHAMEYVVRCLVRVFGFRESRARVVMLAAHEQGVAVCATEPRPRAREHRDQLASLGLLATIEPAP